MNLACFFRAIQETRFGTVRSSRLKTRQLVPHHNATGLQVTSAVLAGMVWALDTPRPASWKLKIWTSGAAWRSRSPILALSLVSIRTGRLWMAGLGSSRRTSTHPIPGSSGMCWFHDSRRAGQRRNGFLLRQSCRHGSLPARRQLAWTDDSVRKVSSNSRR